MKERFVVQLTRLSGTRAKLLLGGLLLLCIVACGEAATATSPPATAERNSSGAQTEAGLVPETATDRNQATTSGGETVSPGPGATPVGTPAPAPTAEENQVATGGGETVSPGPGATPGGTPAPELPDVPAVDRSIHSVRLEDILFDTFGGSPRFIPLDQATDELILQLRDAIRPINKPFYGIAGDLPWLDDDDLVIGYRSKSDAYAYPVNVLDFHEIVNDVIDGVPVLITYCPLCFSGIVFSRVLEDGRELDGRVLSFGNTSALFMSDLVMYDHQTGSYWFQVGGSAMVGPLTGSKLSLLPSTTIAWGEWKRMHPETRLLTGFGQAPKMFAGSRYVRGISGGLQERTNADRFIFPVDERLLDDRLPSGEIVLTVEIDGAVTAFPLELIGDGAVNVEVAGLPVTVFARTGNRASAAFSRNVDGRIHTFDFRASDQSFVDRETGSVWDAGGLAIGGPLEGSRLEQLNTRRSFWFAVVIAFPGIDLHLP